MKVTKLTNEQVKEIFFVSVAYERLPISERQGLLEKYPHCKEIFEKGHIDLVNNEYILTVKD
jgi:hypothetical protein